MSRICRIVLIVQHDNAPEGRAVALQNSGSKLNLILSLFLLFSCFKGMVSLSMSYWALWEDIALIEEVNVARYLT